MAQALAKINDDAPATGMSGADLIKSMVIALLLGIGGGGAFGYFVIPSAPAPQTKDVPAPTVSSPNAPQVGRFPNDALEIGIPSIIVDLKGEPRSRVRLDLSVVAVHGTSEAGTLKDEVREDVIAYLKGLTVADIQGVRGFQNLREQLDDRAKIRGRGAVLGVLIGGFVIE